jgi:hypothetical protein
VPWPARRGLRRRAIPRAEQLLEIYLKERAEEEGEGQ